MINNYNLISATSLLFLIGSNVSVHFEYLVLSCVDFPVYFNCESRRVEADIEWLAKALTIIDYLFLCSRK